MNLTSSEIPVSKLYLRNLGPKFVPTLNKVPVLDIVASTEQAALRIEKHESFNGSCIKAENLRHNFSKILLKCAKKKLPSNLTKKQETTLKDLKNNDSLKVVCFDKGVGFAVLDKTSNGGKDRRTLERCKRSQ